ncbi:beta-propeller domain-containing protein [Pseudobacteroides cellulosolvens]|uniref:Beta propeller domain-containing protein n=1 Tax=Pseudobacteroides cellulosolvens ATCC 35603 = DSM 2933 TaxID=398512 RepID=A0A0L6JRY9_9FIRM|nr:beta-propeller domain-containing protein [Pseudobacteroides cellulosolvens]KNY28558.1 Beta propeller domain-containing protein [Pseudobacteroides cellulosolvens ATCC 35603 = DSM 2933]
MTSSFSRSTRSLLSITLAVLMLFSMCLVTKAEDSKVNYKVSGFVSVEAPSTPVYEIMVYSPVKVEIEGTDLTATADSRGYFEIVGVPENMSGYTIKFSKRNCLTRTVEGVAVLADTVISTEKEPIMLWSGDVAKDGVQDGAVNLSDAITIATAFNSSSDSPKYKKDCDLNADRSINIADVVIVARNFNKTAQDYRKHFAPLPVVGSFDNLKKMIPASSYSSYYYLDGRVAAGGMPTPAPVAVPNATAVPGGATPSAPKSTDYSKVNSQVEGVDEADVVQTDGEYIYQVNKNKIVVAKAYPADNMEVVNTLNLSADTSFTPREMLLGKNKLIVIGTSYESVKVSPTTLVPVVTPIPKVSTVPVVSTVSPASVTPATASTSAVKSTPAPSSSMGIAVPPTYFIPTYSTVTTKAFILDITDKKDIKKIRVVDIDGNYISSRKIDSVLYLVTNKSIYNYIQFGDTDYAKPRYRDTNLGDSYNCIDYDKINYFPEFIRPNYLNIAGLDVEDNNSELHFTSYLGAGDKMYVSQNNIYIAETNYYSYPVLLARPAVGVSVMPAYNTQNTLIYKFSIDKGESKFKGKGEIPGIILNQYSMDENKGYFRIATTVGSVFGTGENISKNNLYVMDDNFKVTGKIENIAPGEKIYSVRFMGDRGYMVTFKKVDPLFVFDLKDPNKPAILGELKIPGYSDYLHPYDENHVIGFGKDSIESGSDQFAWYQGMKVAMFDITDVNNPKEQFKVLIGDRGTESELLRNPKALLFSKSKNIMAFPVSLYEIPAETKQDTSIKVSTTMPQYGKFAYQGAYIFNIDMEKGFVLKGRITHLADDELAKINSLTYYSGSSDNYINRIMYINDILYTLSNNKIKANNMSDLKELNKVDIVQPSTVSPTPPIYY